MAAGSCCQEEEGGRRTKSGTNGGTTSPPAAGRWFSWMECAQAMLREWWASRMVLEWYLGLDVPDSDQCVVGILQLGEFSHVFWHAIAHYGICIQFK